MSLADQVKDVQRSSPEAKQAWWDYCDNQLGGVRDPNRHEPGVLQGFLKHMGVGGRAPAGRGRDGGDRRGGAPRHQQQQQHGPQHAPQQHQRQHFAPPPQQQHFAPPQQQRQHFAPPPDHFGGGNVGELADFIKTGQRHSKPWKAAWQAYCFTYGNGKFDPNAYDAAFIASYIDYLGDLGARVAAAPPPQAHYAPRAPMPSQKRAPSHAAHSAPPAKRQATGGGSGRGGGGGGAARGGSGGDAADGDPEKASLVDRVKTLQRAGPDRKQVWWDYCDEQQDGVRDPNRHDKATLQSFLDMHE